MITGWAMAYKPPPRSQWDRQPGSWNPITVILAILGIADLCGAVAYLKGAL